MTNFANMIAGGLDLINDQVGEDVVYKRGNDWVKVKAVAGKSKFQVLVSGMAAAEFRSRDFIVASADLVLNGSLIEPQRGDTITQTVGGRKLLYAVARPDNADQFFRFSDFAGTRLRIHTQLQGEA